MRSMPKLSYLKIDGSLSTDYADVRRLVFKEQQVKFKPGSNAALGRHSQASLPQGEINLFDSDPGLSVSLCSTEVACICHE
jgi:hypothetical protein